MPQPDLVIEAVAPIQLNIPALDFEGDLSAANWNAHNCFLLKVLAENHRKIVLRILMGPADETHGHSDLNQHHYMPRFVSAGGGMIWTKPILASESQLHIGSHSEMFYSVPYPIMELIQHPIAEILRDAGASFKEIILCPDEAPHPVWNQEPFNALLNP